MNDRPILFSGPMVCKLLQEAKEPGTGKTQTRRALRYQPIGYSGRKFVMDDDVPAAWQDCDNIVSLCPYGQPGDLLWVRETWGRHNFGISCCGNDLPNVPRRDGGVEPVVHRAEKDGWAWGMFGEPTWKPSIHMPRTASRLTLRISEVRVQPLQDISEADALAEGRSMIPGDPRGYFPDTWEAINGPGAWALNPWVWALTFSVIHSNVDLVLMEAA